MVGKNGPLYLYTCTHWWTTALRDAEAESGPSPTRAWALLAPGLKLPRWLKYSPVAGSGGDVIRPGFLDVVGLSWLTGPCNVTWTSKAVSLYLQTGMVVSLFNKGDWRVCTFLNLSGKVYSEVLEGRSA